MHLALGFWDSTSFFSELYASEDFGRPNQHLEALFEMLVRPSKIFVWEG